MSRPTDEALRAFASAVLSNLPETLAEPAAIDEAVAVHRDLWLMLYRVELEEAARHSGSRAVARPRRAKAPERAGDGSGAEDD